MAGFIWLGAWPEPSCPTCSPAILPAAFYAMGRFSQAMERFEVALVHDDYAALTGCANALAWAAELS